MPSSPGALHQTFRDPAGSLDLRFDAAIRRISPSHAAETLRFLNHPLAKTLVAQGRLIGSEVSSPEERLQTYSSPIHAADNTQANQPAESQPLLLRHPRISFVSYPWEWPPALWLAAAELTLGLAMDLLPEGWILKDATPLNVLFEGTRPVFVDVLSIERTDFSQPTWLAYGQFVRTFILPMLAHVRLGWPLHAVIMRRDGFEPEEIYSALPWHARIRQPALFAVTLPTLLARKGAALARKGSVESLPVVRRKSNDPELTRHVLLKTFKSLRRQMRRTTPEPRSSTWSDYAGTATHYSEAGHAAKHHFVAAVLSSCKPRRVLDVGCNTGTYSRLAAEAGASVVAIDTDLQAVNHLAASLQAISRQAISTQGSGLDILPLCVDIAHPTPATGWENRESASFLSRCEGQFDTVLMLAVLHHLLLGSQIPLDRIAALCASLTTRNLLLEWVPPSDPKFQQLLRGRGDIYAHLTEPAFRQAFASYFSVAQEITLENGRTLFHLVRRVG